MEESWSPNLKGIDGMKTVERLERQERKEIDFDGWLDVGTEGQGRPMVILTLDFGNWINAAATDRDEPEGEVHEIS